MASEKIDALELDINAKLTTENLDKLITALGRLSKALDNVNAKRVKEEVKDTGDASKEATVKIDGLTNSFLNQTVRITALIAVYRKLADVISTGIENSMSYVENMNLFTVSLGQYSQNASKYADTVRDALGIDPSGWIRTQGVFNTLIEGFGVGAEQAAYMSQNLTQLTYDIASFYNLSISDAEKKIQSAVAGELEPVRRLGYDLSQNALTAIAQNPKYYGETTYSVNQLTGALEANSTALEDNTIRTIANFNELTQAEKVQLRYIALMTQVEEAQGDMARTLNDPANQMRIFKEQLSMTSRELGNVFIPALNEVMPYLIAFFRVVEEGLHKIATYLGFELPDMSDRMDVSDDVPYYENIVDATGRAAKNTKKMKDYMIGIDELNVLRPDDGTSGGGSGSTNPYALGSIYKTPGYDFLSSAIENRINDIKEAFDDLGKDFKEHPLEVSLKILYEGAGEVGKHLWSWIFGKTPEELAEEAEKNGQSIGEAFLNAFFNSNLTLPGLGKNIYDYFFGDDSALGKRAAESGRTIGEQFALEYARALLTVINQSEALSWLYEWQTGHNAAADLEKVIEELDRSYKNPDRGGKRYQTKPQEGVYTKKSLGNTSADEARKRGESLIKSYAEGMNSMQSLVASTSGNLFSSAMKGVNNNGSGNSRFKGISTILASNYANGFLSGTTSAKNAGAQLYSSAYSGVSSNTANFSNLGNSLANAFANALGSQKSKNNAYNSAWDMANNGSNGAYSLQGDYYWTGEMAGQGYVAGIGEYRDVAERMGSLVARSTLYRLQQALGIASPSKETYEVGMFFDLGFANAVRDYTKNATEAANEMAYKSVQAIQTTNSMFSGVSIPTRNNMGYGMGAMNEGAMATLASNIYQAVVSGISASGVANNDRDVKVIIDGREVFKVVQSEERKSGAKISDGAFSR